MNNMRRRVNRGMLASCAASTRLSKAIIVTASISLVAAGCTGNKDLGPTVSSTVAPTSDSSKEAHDAAVGMYSAVVAGDYRKAYGYRSQKCREAVAEDKYIAAATSLYSWRKLSKYREPFIIVLTEQTPSTAKIQAIFQDVPNSYNDDKSPRSWVKEEGQWRYDECR
ncbi:hypothetical protein [Tsukamurella sp. NPDC003166]|uniref:hypothetical protein n=1 Tax=Tsukamurella sp. NPDC003166 TaxID=3154444 RepID=UPI0033AB92DB